MARPFTAYMQGWKPKSHRRCGIIAIKGATRGLTSSLNRVIMDVYECLGLFEIFCRSSVSEEGEEWLKPDPSKEMEMGHHLSHMGGKKEKKEDVLILHYPHFFHFLK